MATKYDKAIISKEIGNYLKMKLEEKLNEGLQFQNFNTANELVSTRIPISLEKYAKAIACSKLKTNVEKEDIDEAFSFLNYKLDFLSNYKMTDNDLDKRSTGKIKRKEMIKEKFAGSEFTKKEIIIYFESQVMYVNSRTIDRDIQELLKSEVIKRLERGKYKFC